MNFIWISFQDTPAIWISARRWKKLESTGWHTVKKHTKIYKLLYAVLLLLWDKFYFCYCWINRTICSSWIPTAIWLWCQCQIPVDFILPFYLFTWIQFSYMSSPVRCWHLADLAIYFLELVVDGRVAYWFNHWWSPLPLFIQVVESLQETN